ncbi:hypothetical protein P3102_18840 [Amycolatopsis sp. QT-25]|uniref:hypothetical protein n=1 Tax=unclassified Amycolatopsis TaxID=2618356 RepID=UPI000F7B51DB|nr:MULTISPECIES: hypothetical protein [unclassified Amycolatopsis]RSN46023.1 hypothetical protein DMC64_14875 [Amycolatopsis sp. WAC 04197]WET76196.1 hypothetical protein P3102_18840 [Amycolatopsis sp. QT-25]
MSQFDTASVGAGDPLMPTVQRFPVNAGARPLSDENPSTVRPFILRGVRARRITVRPEAKHRTTAHDTLHPRQCNEDGKMIDDSYTTPDD